MYAYQDHGAAALWTAYSDLRDFQQADETWESLERRLP